MRHLDLLIAAPSDPDGLVGWGDYHFARELQLALHALGVSTRLLHRDTHALVPPAPAGSDLLVLRGKFAPGSDWLRAAPYRRKLIWIISWPLDPTPTELADYDLLLVASDQDRPRLARLSGRPAQTLLQASGLGHRARLRPARGGLLFVGNRRGVERPIVAAFSRAGVAIELIGEGWEDVGLEAESASLANDALPIRYGQALAVLNDHHGAMAAYGYLNNRVFDVLACGVPVITDVAPGCPPELEAGVIRMGPGDEPEEALARARALRRDHHTLAAVAAAARERHSFAARAEALRGVLEGEPADSAKRD
ncbi:glycosyltransferase [Cyanobium sp. CH-040]|uniref:glycosyltransferase family protein n=1 Tax=Cyanobium sp. CH-040 TaxID=2823708 RepID=UPI0020CF2EEC|nr:glycosyltransferase [Cyanobium sp. CH-040]MCP9928002.1 glycosyltransferase family 1 protein [Cyanobium sp. CH-040]